MPLVSSLFVGALGDPPSVVKMVLSLFFDNIIFAIPPLLASTWQKRTYRQMAKEDLPANGKNIPQILLPTTLHHGQTDERILEGGL